MTFGELIEAVLRHVVNRGSASVASDPALRDQARFFGRKVCKRVFDSAPHWFRHNTDTVVLSSGVGTMPSDFANFGEQGDVYLSNNLYHPVRWAEPSVVRGLLQTSPQSGLPELYTLDGQTSLGIPKILCWPTDDSTLAITNYVKKMPEMIDVPLAPVLAEGAAGNPSGAYTGRVTFVTALGETEGGAASASLTVSSKKLSWTSIEVSPARTVTARKLYRPAAGGVQYKLVDTLSDNLTTTYTDDIADGALGANIPTPAAAISGLEIFPEQFHESALFDGLAYFMTRAHGDGRNMAFNAEWLRAVSRMWREQKQGRNAVHASPPFPGRISGHPVWSRFTPPS